MTNRDEWRLKRLVGPFYVLMTTLAFLLGCEDETHFDEFRVRVLGLRTAHDTFPLKVDGYEVTENFYFEGAFVRELNFQKPLAELNVPIVIRSEFEDETIDQVTVQPFLCKETRTNPDIADWNFIEQFDLKVTDEGKLLKNEDIDRNLTYTCNASSPSGEDGEGVGQSWSTLELCVEPDRAGTSVGLSIGQSEPMNPEACWSSYGQSRGGIITVGFRFPLALAGSRMISLQLSTVDLGSLIRVQKATLL